MDENWNMYGKYKVYSIDKERWVEIDFTGRDVKCKTNVKKIFIVKEYTDKKRQVKRE